MGIKTIEKLFNLLDVVEVLPGNLLASHIRSNSFTRDKEGWVIGTIVKITELKRGPFGNGYHYHFVIKEDFDHHVMTITDEHSSILDYKKAKGLSVEEALTHSDRRIRRVAHTRALVQKAMDNYGT